MRKTLLSSLLLATATMAWAQSTATETYKEHSKYIQAVDEYVPAPGQFINTLPKYEEGDNAATMAAKCTDAIAGGNNGMISLGAYGGYVTFHFDHPVANVEGKKDLYIKGNAFTNSSEPGIVMVMKDTNGNGLPDDQWYELSGSADVDSVGKVVYGYEITYTRSDMNDVPWTDNQNQAGTVQRNTLHSQEYFPLWIESPLTFQGTLLPRNAYDQSGQGTYWVLPALRYGYVDNQPNSDIDGCSFDIAWAVDAQRQPVQLDAIDFVRVYCAENQMAGWLGETSTEVCGAEDLHLEASIDSQEAKASVATFENISVGDDGYVMYRPDEVEDMEYYTGAFTSGQYGFNATYMEYSGSPVWSGFAVASLTDTSFSNSNYLTDQFKNAKGGGHNSANYAVAYTYGGCSVDVNAGDNGAVVSGFYLNNNAWAIDAIVNGDGMTAGGFTTGDWFKLTITGKGADGATCTKEVYLADFRSDNEAEHYYLTDWTWVDLSALGAITSIQFALSSSRNNAWGMTTPSYFCIDDFGATDDGGATGITRPAAQGHSHAVSRYSIDGCRMGALQRGLNIVRMSDGTVRKVLVK